MSLNNLYSKDIGHSMGIAYLSDIGGAGGVTSVTGGTDINITGTASNPIINFSGNPVTVVNAGTGINITGASNTPVINNNGVLGVTAGTDISITGTAQNPIINYIGGAGGGVASVTAGTDISITGTPTNPIINYIGGAGGGVASVGAGTNIAIGGTAPNPTVNLVPNVEIPDGGYIGIGGSLLPAPIPTVNCIRMYKNPARTLWSAFLTAPNPPPPLVGGDALNLVNESKDFDALSVGNIKIYNQGDNYDVVNPFLHIGAVAGSQYGIAYNDPNTTETIFMDTTTTNPPTFNLYNISQINNLPYIIPSYISVSSLITQTPPAGSAIPLKYDTIDVSLNMSLVGGVGDSKIRNDGIMGLFSVRPSIQFSTTSGQDKGYIYLQINGTPVPNSGYFITCVNNAETLGFCENIIKLNNNDFVEVMLYSVGGQIQATAFTTQPPPIPNIPSIITTIQRIG